MPITKADIGKVGSKVLSPISVPENNKAIASRMPFGDSMLSSFNLTSIDEKDIFASTPKPKDAPLTIDELMTQPIHMPLVTKRKRPTIDKENITKRTRVVAAPNVAKREAGASVANVLQEMARQSTIMQPSAATRSKKVVRPSEVKTSTLSAATGKRSARSGQRKMLAHVVRADMHDAEWMTKQEATFTQILNWELRHLPIPFPSAATIGSLADSSEELRKAACDIYGEMVAVYKRVSEALDFKKIRLRDDVDLAQDVGKRAALIHLLSSYDSMLLCLGAEVISGMQVEIRLTANQVVINSFIEETWFNDRHLEAKYLPENGPSATKRYHEAIQKHLVLRFLMLVLLLDNLKTKDIISHCLFTASSPFKSTRELVTSFSNMFLSGEGAVLRHLLHLGYAPSYHQIPFSEFDWRISSLATDLRDGIRLCGALKEMSGDEKALENVRFPAVSRQVQLHNVSVAIEFCQAHGVLPALPSAPLSAAARYNMIVATDIVDGHREKTLSLLWRIIAHWKLRDLVHERILEVEVQRLGGEDEILPTSSVSPVASLLLQWTALISRLHQGPVVRTFAASFADGQVWCLLVHHYAPHLIARDDIKDPKAYLEQVKRGEVDLAKTVPSSTAWFLDANSITDPNVEAQKMSRGNLDLLIKAIKELGDVPPLFEQQDVNEVLDEKSVISVLAYLFSRLVGDAGTANAGARRIEPKKAVEMGTPMISRALDV